MTADASQQWPGTAAADLQPRQATAGLLPDGHEQLPGPGHEGAPRKASDSAPQYKAYAFNDEEDGRGDLQSAGGLGMLGYRFHRHTRINW